MNIYKLIQKTIKIIFNTKNTAENKETEINKEYRSNNYEKKLALIIKEVNSVDNNDLKYVQITKLDNLKNNDLFSAFRLDFHTRDKLHLFKKKYKSLLL